MNKKEAEQLVSHVLKRFPEGSSGRLILEQFRVDECYREAYAKPVSLECLAALSGWKTKKDQEKIKRDIRELQQLMDASDFPFRTSVFLMHEEGYCYLLLGEEQVSVERERHNMGGRRNVNLAFERDSISNEVLPSFSSGATVDVSASSPIRGWLYLFLVDSDYLISPVYPGEGQKSGVLISKNSRRNITDQINEEMMKMVSFSSTKMQPLQFCGDKCGRERIVALVVDSELPIPVTITHLRSRLPLPLLFGHAHRSEKGIGGSPVNSENDFSSLELSQIAVGTLDYYYKP